MVTRGANGAVSELKLSLSLFPAWFQTGMWWIIFFIFSPGSNKGEEPLDVRQLLPARFRFPFLYAKTPPRKHAMQLLAEFRADQLGTLPKTARTNLLASRQVFLNRGRAAPPSQSDSPANTWPSFAGPQTLTSPRGGRCCASSSRSGAPSPSSRASTPRAPSRPP